MLHIRHGRISEPTRHHAVRAATLPERRDRRRRFPSGGHRHVRHERKPGAMWHVTPTLARRDAVTY
ncbi:hypothetical protein SAMN04487905_11017 [Actinopolyspora xinjiangensis]|uniref:Uncharacterized protein n=1 Tax=Actinopolyspora xinjiangensis TaxID=405564 RepID=A0A1H0VYB6_9ACTN|nr:hypothetical protein SAMN04487905_11017 [Actinopolyspora xinjiangensis]